MEADAVRVVGKDPDKPLQEECSTGTAAHLHRPAQQPHHQPLQLGLVLRNVRETRLKTHQLNSVFQENLRSSYTPEQRRSRGHRTRW